MATQERDRLMSEQYTGPSQRFIDAVAHGEVTKGGLAEAGWFDVGRIADGEAPLLIQNCRPGTDPSKPAENRSQDDSAPGIDQ